jgi:hypothetical protein
MRIVVPAVLVVVTLVWSARPVAVKDIDWEPAMSEYRAALAAQSRDSARGEVPTVSPERMAELERAVAALLGELVFARERRHVVDAVRPH